jgi:hypothetical protein
MDLCRASQLLNSLIKFIELKKNQFFISFSGPFPRGVSVIKPVGIIGEKMTAKARVQKHRAKLMTEQCGRLEAWVSNDLIEALRTIAKQQNRYLWAVVREALKTHVTRHAALVKAPHCK